MNRVLGRLTAGVFRIGNSGQQAPGRHPDFAFESTRQQPASLTLSGSGMRDVLPAQERRMQSCARFRIDQRNCDHRRDAEHANACRKESELHDELSVTKLPVDNGQIRHHAGDGGQDVQMARFVSEIW